MSTDDARGTASRSPDDAPAHDTEPDAHATQALTPPPGNWAAERTPLEEAARAAAGEPEREPRQAQPDPAVGTTATAASATAATSATTGAGAAPPATPFPGVPAAAAAGAAAAGAALRASGPVEPSAGAPTTVLTPERRPERPRADRTAGARPASRPAARPVGRSRRARLVVQRVDPWSVFLFSLVASICLGIVLLVAVMALYSALSALGVLSSLNTLLGEVLGDSDEVGAPFFTLGRVLGVTAVLAAVDVVLLTILATLSALLYNLCSSLTGGIEVVLGERD